MVTIRKPSPQSVIVDYLIIGMIPVNALSVLATDCREMSTAGYREEDLGNSQEMPPEQP
jgi:hypothetical protein